MRELVFSEAGTGRLALPNRCSVDVSCLASKDIQDAVMVALEESLYIAASSGIDLTELDGVTVAVDCQAAASAIHGLQDAEVSSELASQSHVLEMARTVAVRRGSGIGFQIVVRPGVILMRMSTDESLRRLAQACIAHESAHVEHESRLYRTFSSSFGMSLECGDRSQQTFIKAIDVWSEYAACRSSATFRPEAVEEFEVILCRTIADGSAVAANHVETLRQGCDTSSLSRTLQQIFGNELICAGYLLGHIHGVGRQMKDCTPHLDELIKESLEVKQYIERLEDILHDLWLQESDWPSIEVFAPIYDLICERMSHFGLFLVASEDGWRVTTS